LNIQVVDIVMVVDVMVVVDTLGRWQRDIQVGNEPHNHVTR
jgi:hypothetical protein